MTGAEAVRAVLFADASADCRPTPPVLLPDLYLWYARNRERGSLPAAAAHAESAPEAARALGATVWCKVRPWRTVFADAVEQDTQSADERHRRITVGDHTLVSTWKRGPDGDWWQTAYPVGDVRDLQAVATMVAGRSFTPEPDVFLEATRRYADLGVVAVELPARPFSWLMLEMLGWSEGLMLLFDQADLIDQIISDADAQLQRLISDIVGALPDDQPVAIYSPDNLDGQFVSPAYFDSYLSDSYRKTSQTLRNGGGGNLMVHAGGPVRPLLEPLAAAGVQTVCGVSGPPQGDTPPSTVAAVRPPLTVWGGIPQDVLLPATPEEQFHATAEEILHYARSHPRIIVGVADHVPEEADPTRLQELIDLFLDNSD